jgi:thioesterase domain-containing protein
MFAKIEKHFGVRLPVASMYREATVAYVSKLIGRQKGYSDWYSLVSLQMRGAKRPFYIVHDFGGCVGDYGIWSKLLGDDQPFFGLGARGYGIEPPYERIEDMAAHYIEEIKDIQPQGPYYVGGYGFGGVVAFEIAQQLAQQGERNTVLLIINTEAPRSSYRSTRLTFQFVRGFVFNLPHWIIDWFHRRPKDIMLDLKHRVKRREKKALHNTESASFGVGGSSIPSLRDRLVSTNEHALAYYSPSVYEGEITLLRTARQPLFCSFEPTLGWSKWCKRVTVHRVGGSMTTIIFNRSHAQQVANVMRETFDLASEHLAAQKKKADT